MKVVPFGFSLSSLTPNSELNSGRNYLRLLQAAEIVSKLATQEYQTNGQDLNSELYTRLKKLETDITFVAMSFINTNKG